MAAAELKEIDAFFDVWAPKTLSEPWDNDGIMLCPDTESSVKTVLVCLEVNDKVVREARACGASLIVTHHPLIFHPLPRIWKETYTTLRALIDGGIAVFSYHTRLDAAPGGVNDVLAEKLLLSEIRPFGGAHGIGRVGKLPQPMTADRLIRHVRERLSTGPLRCAVPDPEKPIVTVAVVGGGGKEFLTEASRTADAYITADLSHNAFLDAQAYRLCAIDAGHYHTENPVTNEIARRLREAFPALEVRVSDVGCPFVVR